jgi:hypothetical protein
MALPIAEKCRLSKVQTSSLAAMLGYAVPYQFSVEVEIVA